MERVRIIPGLAIAAYSRDGHYVNAFGVTDVDTGEPATTDTAFYIASSTKSMTALAFSILAARRQLDLDMPLSQFAPDAPFPASVRPNEVRIRDLLTHTSGISNDAIGFRVAFTGQHDPELLWRLLASSTPNTEAPLGTFMYTNVGYNIATIMSDRRLGVRWQDLLQRELFDPAGLSRTTAVMSRARNAGWSIARPHIFFGQPRAERIYLEKTDQTMQSAGGVVMSAKDAARWLNLLVEDGAVDGRQVVNAQAVRATRQPLATTGEDSEGYRREHYGLGWHMGPHRGTLMLHQFGGFAGFRTHISYMPERHVGVAVMCNDNTVGAEVVNPVANYLYDRMAGAADAETVFEAAIAQVIERRETMGPALQQMAASRAARPSLLTRPIAAYVGRYENDDFGTIEIALAGAALEVRFGVLHAVATPFTRPDSIRVELEPGSGRSVQFAGSGATPDSLTYQDITFRRRP